MRRIIVALAVMACVLLAWAGTASASGETIPGSYIVVVKPGNDPKTVAGERGAKTKHVYRDAINGFSAQLSDDQVAKLKASKKVSYVEQDRVYSTTTTQTGATWGATARTSRARSAAAPTAWRRASPCAACGSSTARAAARRRASSPR